MVVESSIAVLLVLVARVSVAPKVSSPDGAANLKSLPADLHLARRSMRIHARPAWPYFFDNLPILAFVSFTVN